MTAGRRIHETVDMIDMIDMLVSVRLGVHRNDLRCLHLLEDGPATPGEVAAKTGLTSGSVTALLDRLEGAGFIERRRSCADRRSVELAMSECKLAELRAIYSEIETWIRDFYNDQPVGDVIESGRALSVFADLMEGFAAKYAAAKACPALAGPQ